MIEAKWGKYASVKRVIIGIGNDMLAIQYQAITWPIDQGEYTWVKFNLTYRHFQFKMCLQMLPAKFLLKQLSAVER